MAQRTQISSRWSLVNQAQQGKFAGPLDSSQLIAPFIPGSSLTPLLSGLMPNRDHNQDLLRYLQLLPKARGAAQPLFSVFAAHPFFKAKHVAQPLRDRGFHRVINWPTTAQYGVEFAQALDSVNLGPQQECRNLLQMAQAGLTVSLAVCGAEGAAEIARLRPEMLFLAPTFELWVKAKLRTAELLRRCAALARAVEEEIPIVVMASRGSVSFAQARKAGATALLLA